MCKIIAIFVLTISINAFALISPFPSTIPEVDIRNSHYVDNQKKLVRGMAPLGKANQLKTLGVTKILIFKNQTRKEVDQEIEELLNAGYKNSDIYQFDFYWHKYPSYKQACVQTIEALKLMRNAVSTKGKLFFHCTVGEDRTGYLAGLWRMLEQGHDKNRVFTDELCLNGYEKGNPNKPMYVVNEIRRDLTPLFTYMAKLITDGKLRLNYLTKRYCKDEIPLDSELKCQNSPRFPRD